jgi:hypothetical protein
VSRFGLITAIQTVCWVGASWNQPKQNGLMYSSQHHQHKLLQRCSVALLAASALATVLADAALPCYLLLPSRWACALRAAGHLCCWQEFLCRAGLVVPDRHLRLKDAAWQQQQQQQQQQLSCSHALCVSARHTADAGAWGCWCYAQPLSPAGLQQQMPRQGAVQQLLPSHLASSRMQLCSCAAQMLKLLWFCPWCCYRRRSVCWSSAASQSLQQYKVRAHEQQLDMHAHLRQQHTEAHMHHCRCTSGNFRCGRHELVAVPSVSVVLHSNRSNPCVPYNAVPRCPAVLQARVWVLAWT